MSPSRGGAYFALAGRPVIFSSKAKRLVQRVADSRADVDGESCGPFCLAGQQIGFDNVPDVDEVARLFAVAKHDRLRSV